MLGRPASYTVAGPVGLIEVVREDPSGVPRGLAVIAHPHPLMGGTLDNKVVHTVARAFVLAGWRAVRFNFRGVGRSDGTWDEGAGEVDDLLAVLASERIDPTLLGKPVALAGFSFGGYVAASANARLTQAALESAPHSVPQELVLISPATSRYSVPTVPAHTLVVQGEQDDVIPLAAIFDWARPQALPVTVIPGTGHFFHGQLAVLRAVVLGHLRAASGDL